MSTELIVGCFGIQLVILKCLKCSTVFPWNNRYNLKRQRKCANSHERIPTPERWVSERMYTADYREAFQRVRHNLDPHSEFPDNSQEASSSSGPAPKPRYRLRTKTNVTDATPSHTRSDNAVSSEGLQLFVHFDDMG